MMQQQQQQRQEEEEEEAAVQQFCSLTNCSPQQARFFLESCSWQLESAVQNFYETDSGAQAEEEQDWLPVPAQGPASLSPSAGSVRPPGNPPQAVPAAGDVPGDGPLPASGSGKPPAKDGQAGGSSRGGVRTLSGLDGLVESGGHSDGPQEYYAGGEKSGMLVQGPSKGNGDIDAIFDQARRMGAQEGPLELPQAPSSNRSIFTGIARTLGGGTSEQVGQSSQVVPIVRNIIFWRNGFTVDDGPLRRLDDPANAQFLASISKSVCPKELEPADHSSPVDVNLIRKDEEWQPPPEPKHVPFRGVGRTLGSSDAPEASSVPTSRTVSSQPFQGLVVDESKHVTSIQLRLSDGTRMVARFNHHHTVADIRGFIDSTRPGNMGTYQLQAMGFPPRILTNLSETVEQAGLFNTVVIQKS